MATLDRVPTQIAPPPEAHAEAVRSIRAGQPFTCVLCDDPAERSALLQSVTDTVADLETRFVYVGNPLRAPLTLERLFMQAVGPEADVRLQRDGAALTRILATSVGDEARLIVVVEQPESLDSEALQTLQAMGPSFSRVVPRVQIVFCGPVAFRAMIEPPGVGEGASAAPVPRAEPSSAPAPQPVPALPSPVPRRRKWPMVVTTLLLLLAAGVALAWRMQPQLRAWLGPFMPQLAAAPAGLAAAPAQPSANAPAVPTANPAEEEGMLRREFDDFMATRPDAAGLTGAQKDELFKEFLLRRRSRVQ